MDKVLNATFLVTDHFKERETAAQAKAPMAPTAAASVGVAMPEYIAPNTRITRRMGKMVERNERTFSRQLVLSSTGMEGASCG
ncbi:MAG: hypothetical protein A2137_01615 [Chloroflexi bacterium RBG_16_58_8]|nr:MAG: hypothetical protein A2137_01615 [Chloroflexi bacterium RBG_16_58_8]